MKKRQVLDADAWDVRYWIVQVSAQSTLYHEVEEAKQPEFTLSLADQDGKDQGGESWLLGAERGVTKRTGKRNGVAHQQHRFRTVFRAPSGLLELKKLLTHLDLRGDFFLPHI